MASCNCQNKSADTKNASHDCLNSSEPAPEGWTSLTGPDAYKSTTVTSTHENYFQPNKKRHITCLKWEKTISSDNEDISACNSNSTCPKYKQLELDYAHLKETYVTLEKDNIELQRKLSGNMANESMSLSHEVKDKDQDIVHEKGDERELNLSRQMHTELDNIHRELQGSHNPLMQEHGALVVKHQNEVQKHDEAKKFIEGTIKVMQKESAEFNILKDENKQLEIKYTQLKGKYETDISLATSLLDQERDKCQKATQELELLRSRESSVTKTLELNKELEEVKYEKDQVTNELQKLRGNKNSMTSRIEQLKQTIQEASDERERNIKDLYNLRESEKSNEAIIQQLQKDIELLSNQRGDNVAQALQNLRDNEKTKDKIIEELSKDLKVMEHDRDGYRSKVIQLGGHHSNSKENDLEKRLEEQNEQHKKMVTIFQKEIKSLQDKNREMQDEYQKQKNDKESLSQRLAVEWSEKVSSDESNIENVSIKNRPMTIADEMQQLLNTEWLEAKGDIDSQCASASEEERRRFLCEILMMAEKHAKEYLTVIIDGIFTLMFHALWDPFHRPNANTDICDKSSQTEGNPNLCDKSSQTPGDEVNHVDDVMDYGQRDHKKTECAGTSNTSQEDKLATHHDPKQHKEYNKSGQARNDKNAVRQQTDTEIDQLKNGMRDFLRVRADDLNTAPLVKKIEDELHGYAVMISIKGNTNFTSYLVACIKLAWKMVIQSPSMEFDVKGLGEKYNPNRHEPSYDSDNPNDASSKILYYVHPTLLHANKVMVKGKVHIKKTHEQ